MGAKRAVEDQLSDRSLYPRIKWHRRMSGMGEPCLYGFQLGALE
ncbi:MAG: hypothetical protein GHHEDOFH_02350 [Pseudorhodoplanes sp.]|nr:hypothetical protein [Pseudorhodoplanes sp.]